MTEVKIHRAQLRQAEELLALILPGTAPADRQMDQYFRQRRQMGRRDRAFVAETVYGCLRQRRYLEYLLNVAGVTADAAALVAMYLVVCSGWSARVLADKGYAGDTECLVRAARATGRDSVPFPVRANLPDWLAERLLAQYGETEALALADALNQPATVDLRVNTLKTRREALQSRLAADGYASELTPYSNVGLRRRERGPLFAHPAFQAGEFEVQDEGSQLIGLLVAPHRRGLVVDFCAGAGGKTLHLATQMENTGSVVACDVSRRRLENLRPRLRRAGLDNVRLLLIRDEHDAQLDTFRGKADRVLVDVPCSGTGTLRRNPDIKWRSIDLATLATIQRSILAAAATLVNPGGRLVYATCSLLEEENQAVVADFLAAQPDFASLAAAEVLACHGIVVPESDDGHGNMALLPHRHGSDGFYAAVMERRHSK